MENASKALLIAGGVLLAVLVLSLFGLLLSNISSNQMAQEKTKQAEQLKEFNQQWEAYNKKALYGTDIITVVNKAIQNNKENRKEYKGHLPQPSCYWSLRRILSKIC